MGAAVGGGCAPGQPLEGSAEVLGAGVAHIIGNGFDRGVGCDQ